MFDHGYGVHLQMRNRSLYLSVHDQLLSLPPLIALQATRNHHCVMHDSKTPFLHNIIWCSTGQKKKTKKPERVTKYNGRLYVIQLLQKSLVKQDWKEKKGMIIIIKRSIRVQNSYWNFEAPLHKSEWPVLKPFHHFQLLSLHKKRWKRKRKTPSRKNKLLPNDQIPHQNNQKS